jgi:hypothetical protein
VESIIDSENGYMFTNDYNYIKNRTDIVPVNLGLEKSFIFFFVRLGMIKEINN